MCDETTAAILHEIDQLSIALEKTAQRTEANEAAIQRMERAESALLNNLAQLLRDQAANNLQTSHLLNDLSEAVTHASFEISELRQWQKRLTGGEGEWIAEHRADQLKATYVAVKSQFDDSELRELIMNLNIPWSDISGDSISEKALWLVEYCRRNGKFWNLVKEIRKMRPHSILPKETGQLSDVH